MTLWSELRPCLILARLLLAGFAQSCLCCRCGPSRRSLLRQRRSLSSRQWRAVALGVTRAPSIGVFAADYQVVVGAGAGFASGAVRGFAGAASNIWSVGAGYARTIAARQLTESARTSAGVQLIAGYRHDK